MSSQRYLQKVQGETSFINHLLCKSSLWLTKSHPAADAFIFKFYRALERQRDAIASLYVPYQELPENEIVPRITINGNSVRDGPELQTRFKEEMPRLKYVVELFNCHVLDQDFRLTTGKGNEMIPGNGKNLRLGIAISGTVEVGEGEATEYREYSESLVIVPILLQKGKSKSASYDFLIEMQNFRFVV